jgi:hypothetical protein
MVSEDGCSRGVIGEELHPLPGSHAVIPQGALTHDSTTARAVAVSCSQHFWSLARGREDPGFEMPPIQMAGDQGSLRNQSTNSEGVISAMEKMFAIHGIPDAIRTDNGPPFNSKDFKAFAKRAGFHTQKVTPLWLEANGQAESFMKCLGKVVRTAHIESRDWKKALDEFLMAYRATPHPSTDVAPAHLMFPGRRFKTFLPYHSFPSNSEATINDFNKRAMEAAKQYADKRRRTRHFSLLSGDIDIEKKHNKLSTHYDPLPYRVKATKGSKITAERDGKEIVQNSSFFKKIVPQALSSNKIPTASRPTAAAPVITSGLPILAPDRSDNCFPVTNPAAPQLRLPGNGQVGGGVQAERSDPAEADGGESGDDEFVDAEGENQNIQANAGAPPIAAFHPSGDLSIDSETFSLPSDPTTYAQGLDDPIDVGMGVEFYELC